MTKPGFDAQSYIQRYGDFKQWLYYSFLVYCAEEMKFTASAFDIITLMKKTAWILDAYKLYTRTIIANE